MSETDHYDNLVNSIRIATNTYGKSKEQAKAIIGDAVKQLMAFVKGKHKPIVIEKMDFAKKGREVCRASLGNTLQCKLSDIFYGRVCHSAHRFVIGFWKFVSRYGISGHQAAVRFFRSKAVSSITTFSFFA